MSDIEEVSKAAAEVSKFGTKALGTTEKILGFLSKVFKEPLEDVAGIVGDRLKFLRWERQVRMAEEVTKILEERNLSNTKPVAPKLALPIIENASLEEDDSLQNIWINLMANSMDPNFKNDIRFAYIEIIKSLEPVDARLLEYFYDVLINDPKVDLAQPTDFSLTKEVIAQGLGLELNQCILSIYNLFRAQCLSPAILRGGVKIGHEALTVYKGVDAVTMTLLGIDFVKACIKR